MKKLIIIILLCSFPAVVFAGTCVVKKKGGCSSTYGTELHTAANAAAPSASDTNATTGWVGTGLATYESTTTTPSLGTYHLHGVANSDTDRMSFDISSLTVGTLYRVSVDVRSSGSGGDFKVGLSPTVSTSATFASKQYTSANNTYAAFDRYFYRSSEALQLTVLENGVDTADFYVDNLTIKAVSSSCLGPELFTAANAASISNEANATTGFTKTGVDTFQSTSTGTPDNGTYHLEIAEPSSGGTSGARATFDLSTLGLIDGTSYLISVKARHNGTGGQWNAVLVSSDTTSSSLRLGAFTTPSDDNYTIRGIEIIYSPSVRYLVFHEQNTPNDGGIFVDSISVKEILSR